MAFEKVAAAENVEEIEEEIEEAAESEVDEAAEVVTEMVAVTPQRSPRLRTRMTFASLVSP